jgi:teichuronic acid biosynthesis glycosyltransferase TuaH
VISTDPRSWDGLVVLCAANSYDSVKVADQHIAEQLSTLTPVLYVDPPLSRLTPAKNPELAGALEGPRLRLLTPRLARLTPVVQPFPSRPGIATLTTALAGRHIRRAASILGGQVWALISAWPLYPVFGSCREQVRVYWAQDDFVGGAALMGMNAKQLDARERKVAAAADLIIAANPIVAATWRSRGGDPVVIPYGADAPAYRQVDQAPIPSDVSLSGPVVGYVGQINDRTDLSLLEAVADRGLSLLLVGPVNPAFEPARFGALRRRENVCWVGPKPFEALPGYFRSMDVGLVPYRDSPFNRGSFPLKTLEYLAAGRAVVATDLPAIRRLDTDLIAVATEPTAFADQVARLASQTRTQALVARRQAFAAQHSWSQRAADIVAAISATKTARARIKVLLAAQDAAQYREPLSRTTAQLFDPVRCFQTKPLRHAAGEAEVGKTLVERLIRPVLRLRQGQQGKRGSAVVVDAVQTPVGLERHVAEHGRHRGDRDVVKQHPAADLQGPGDVVPVHLGERERMRTVNERRVEDAVTAEHRGQHVIRQADHEVDPAVVNVDTLAVFPDPLVFVGTGANRRMGGAGRSEQDRRRTRPRLDGGVAILHGTQDSLQRPGCAIPMGLAAQMKRRPVNQELLNYSQAVCRVHSSHINVPLRLRTHACCAISCGRPLSPGQGRWRL